jgi:ubiquinone/menaquinone biosynthesis C-methylase UbiE
MSHAKAKQAQQQSWTAVAPGWRKNDAILVEAAAPVSERLLDRAGIERGMRVLDIASGTGEPAIPAARRVGAGGFVLGTDFVEPMLQFAREKAASAGLGNVEFRCVDGEVLDVESGSFDAATIRWGLMFMPDAVACMRQVHRALRSTARMAVACWAEPERNPWASLPMRHLLQAAQLPAPTPGAPGLFAYADPARLQNAVAAAGFASVTIEPVEITMTSFDTAAEYWSYTLEMAGPIAALFGALPPSQQHEVAQAIMEDAERLSPGGRIVLRGVTWVASGTRV